MSTATTDARLVSEQKKLIKRIQEHLERHKKDLPRGRKTQEFYVSKVFASALKMWKVTAQEACAGFGTKLED